MYKLQIPADRDGDGAHLEGLSSVLTLKYAPAQQKVNQANEVLRNPRSFLLVHKKYVLDETGSLIEIKTTGIYCLLPTAL